MQATDLFKSTIESYLRVRANTDEQFAKSFAKEGKTIEGERLETIEVSLDDYSIVQSRAIYNGSTPQHQDILRLMNDHMDEIRRAAV